MFFFSKAFLSGYIRMLDPSRDGGQCEEPELDGPQKDYLALKGDWERVGKTIREAAGCFTSDNNNQRTKAIN